MASDARPTDATDVSSDASSDASSGAAVDASADAETIKEHLHHVERVIRVPKKYTSRRHWRVADPPKQQLRDLVALADALGDAAIYLGLEDILVVCGVNLKKRKRRDAGVDLYKELPKCYLAAVDHAIGRAVLLGFLNRSESVCEFPVKVSDDGTTLVMEPLEPTTLTVIRTVDAAVDADILWDFTWSPRFTIRVKYL